MIKNLPLMWQTWVSFLGWEDVLEEGMATHSSILAWRILMDRGAWWATALGSQQSDRLNKVSADMPGYMGIEPEGRERH